MIHTSIRRSFLYAIVALLLLSTLLSPILNVQAQDKALVGVKWWMKTAKSVSTT